MNNLRILDAWRSLLPSNVAIGAGPLLHDAPELTPSEQLSAGTMEHGRMLEFKSGRAYAKRALSKFGFHKVDLAVGADRAPIWPAGVRGSITHTAGPAGGHVAVAVASSDLVENIGIDAEVNLALHPAMWSAFLTDGELRNIRELPMRFRGDTVLTIWCVKEAAIKALGKQIDRKDIEVLHNGSMSLDQDVWKALIAPRGAVPITLEARTVWLAELVLGAVVTRRKSDS